MILTENEKRKLVRASLEAQKQRRFIASEHQFLFKKEAGILSKLKSFFNKNLASKLNASFVKKLLPEEGIGLTNWILLITSGAILYGIYRGLKYMKGLKLQAVYPPGHRPKVLKDENGNPVQYLSAINFDFKKSIDLKAILVGAAMAINALTPGSVFDEQLLWKFIMLNSKVITRWIKRHIGAPVKGFGRHEFMENPLGSWDPSSNESVENNAEDMILASIGEAGEFAPDQRHSDKDKLEFTFDLNRFGNFKVGFSDWHIVFEFTAVYSVTVDNEEGGSVDIEEETPIEDTLPPEFSGFDF